MTLTEASYWTRKGGVLGGAGIIGIVLLWQAINLISPGPKIPEKYLVPNNECGILPAITLSSLDIPADFSNIEIETETGQYPDLPKIVNVYQFEPTAGQLDARTSAITIAEAFGFSPDTITRPSYSEYSFQNQTLGRTLIVETSNNNFTITTDLSLIRTTSEVPDPDLAKQIAMRYLSQFNVDSSIIDETLSQVTYFTIGAGNVPTPTNSRIEAKFVRIDLYKKIELVSVEEQYIKSKELGQYLNDILPESPTKRVTSESGQVILHYFSVPIISDKPYTSNINLAIKGNKMYGGNVDDLISARNINWPLIQTPCGTHSLIGEDMAIERVKNEGGYLVDLTFAGAEHNSPLPNDISITSFRVFDISLAYLDTVAKQDYLQPIYVVEGEAQTNQGTANFIIYVPAIDYSLG